MSGLSSYFMGSREAMEKPSFPQTFNLLSWYFKENNGFLGDLSHGMSSFDEIKGMPMVGTPSNIGVNNLNTMNLFPSIVPNHRDSTGVPTTWAPPMTREINSMDLFPQHSGFSSKDEFPMFDHSVNKPVPEASQMTIFYGGQVFVFDEISADKAKTIMHFASKASYQDPSVFASTPIMRPIETPNTMGFNFVNTNMLMERFASSIDFPLARKASLIRFLERRKDRILATAPYQTSYSKTTPSKDNMKSWLGLSFQSPPHQYEHSS